MSVYEERDNAQSRLGGALARIRALEANLETVGVAAQHLLDEAREYSERMRKQGRGNGELVPGGYTYDQARAAVAVALRGGKG